MYTWEDLSKANAAMKTTPIKGKDYVEVNERITAFRKVCPGGAIVTEMLSNANGVCVFRATVYNEDQNIIGTGTAYEKENSSNINKTSYIENCETSAVGRALGMCGFGISTSIASFEEVANAISNQQSDAPQGAKPYTPKQSTPKQSAPKQLTPRQQLVAKCNEKGIDATEYAKEHGIDKMTPDEVIFACIKALEG